MKNCFFNRHATVSRHKIICKIFIAHQLKYRKLLYVSKVKRYHYTHTENKGTFTYSLYTSTSSHACVVMVLAVLTRVFFNSH